MGKVLAVMAFLLFLGLQIALYYVIAPFLLVAVLGIFNVYVSFWGALCIMFLLYLLLGIVKNI